METVNAMLHGLRVQMSNEQFMVHELMSILETAVPITPVADILQLSLINTMLWGGQYHPVNSTTTLALSGCVDAMSIPIYRFYTTANSKPYFV
jgi:uncharacterized membrane protein YvlD (DUF360 family)